MAEYGTMFNRNRIDLAQAIPLPAPLVIQLEAAGFCNLRCNFCPVNDNAVQAHLSKSWLEPAVFAEFVRQCEQFPVPIKVLRFIGNGEPLLNRHIAEYVRQAKLSGAFERVEITSNGTLLTSALSDALIEAGLDTLKISLEATEDETFAAIAGANISVADIRAKLTYFYQHRQKCKLYIKTTNMAVPTSEQRDKFLHDYGQIADYIFVETVTDIWPEYTDPKQNKPRYNRAATCKKPVCIQPFYLLGVMADGTAEPCCADWQRKLELGNIVDIAMPELWQGDRLRALRLALLQGEATSPCAVCNFPAVSQSDYIDTAKDEILRRIIGA